MKSLCVILTVLPIFSLCQAEKNFSTVSLTERRALFWNVRNYIEFVVPEIYDSAYVSMIGGDFISRDFNFGYIIPKDERFNGLRGTTIFLIATNDTLLDTVMVRDFDVVRLPDPKIYFGGIDLQSNLDVHSDYVLFGAGNFTAEYNIPLIKIIGINDIHFTIKSWTAHVGDVAVQGRDVNSMTHLIAAVTEAKKGTLIKFTSFEVLGPDGTVRIITINATYLKKGKQGTLSK